MLHRFFIWAYWSAEAAVRRLRCREWRSARPGLSLRGTQPQATSASFLVSRNRALGRCSVSSVMFNPPRAVSSADGAGHAPDK